MSIRAGWDDIASVCFGTATLGGWTLNLALVVPLAVAFGLYATGVARLWRKAGVGRGASWPSVACFGIGWLAAVGALLSPLHSLSPGLFAAHMIEHTVLMVVAVPLLVLSRPLGVMLWALPAGCRTPVAGAVRVASYLVFWNVITRPLAATMLHVGALWLWHAPLLFEAALRNEGLHWLQHFSFVATALLFWWAMLDPRAPFTVGIRIFCLFATSMLTGFLGVLFTFLPRPIFPLQSVVATQWGLTPLADQQLAGLIMWVPGGMVYLGAALALAGRWLGATGRNRHHAEGARLA